MRCTTRTLICFGLNYIVSVSSAWKNGHQFVVVVAVVVVVVVVAAAAAAAAVAAAASAAAVAAAASAAAVDAAAVVLSTLDLLKKVNLMYSSCFIKARMLSLPAASVLTNIIMTKPTKTTVHNTSKNNKNNNR